MPTRKQGTPSPLLRASTRQQWHNWLRRNSASATQIWLVYPKKDSGKPRIPYNDAVEEALCFGWIDSTVRRIDEHHFAQRFTPRKPGTPYSPANQERLRHLIQQGKVASRVLKNMGNLPSARLRVAPDILAAIRSNKQAWANYRKMPPAYKRIRIGFIEGARGRPAEFRKRLAYFIRMTAANKTFGFGGIEKYYK